MEKLLRLQLPKYFVFVCVCKPCAIFAVTQLHVDCWPYDADFFHNFHALQTSVVNTFVKQLDNAMPLICGSAHLTTNTGSVPTSNRDHHDTRYCVRLNRPPVDNPSAFNSAQSHHEILTTFGDTRYSLCSARPSGPLTTRQRSTSRNIDSIVWASLTRSSLADLNRILARSLSVCLVVLLATLVVGSILSLVTQGRAIAIAAYICCFLI